MPQLRKCPAFYLADPFPGETETLADIGQCPWWAICQSVAHFDDVPFRRFEDIEGLEQVAGAGSCHRYQKGVGGIEVLDEVAQLGFTFGADRPVE